MAKKASNPKPPKRYTKPKAPPAPPEPKGKPLKMEVSLDPAALKELTGIIEAVGADVAALRNEFKAHAQLKSHE